MRFYMITVPVIFVCLVAAFFVMLAYFWMQDWADSVYAGDKHWVNYILLYVPTAVYAVMIGILNGIYRMVAKKLNDWGKVKDICSIMCSYQKQILYNTQHIIDMRDNGRFLLPPKCH